MKKLIALVAVVAFLAVASPALAGGHHSSSDVTISNSNYAHVSNTVVTDAYTGGNAANGGSSTNVVSGGGSNGGNVAKDGGNGGNIDTGNATAGTFVGNAVNNNLTRVNAPCNCTGDVSVTNRNGAGVTNDVGTFAGTGDNTANGGSTLNVVSGSIGHHHQGSPSSNGGNLAEDGGNGGNIWTGDATSRTVVVNVVNTNLTRVRR